MDKWKLIGGEDLGNGASIAQNLINRDIVINPDEIYGLLEDRAELYKLRNRINYIEYKLGKDWIKGLHDALAKSDETKP